MRYATYVAPAEIRAKYAHNTRAEIRERRKRCTVNAEVSEERRLAITTKTFQVPHHHIASTLSSPACSLSSISTYDNHGRNARSCSKGRLNYINSVGPELYRCLEGVLISSTDRSVMGWRGEAIRPPWAGGAEPQMREIRHVFRARENT